MTSYYFAVRKTASYILCITIKSTIIYNAVVVDSVSSITLWGYTALDALIQLVTFLCGHRLQPPYVYIIFPLIFFADSPRRDREGARSLTACLYTLRRVKNPFLCKLLFILQFHIEYLLKHNPMQYHNVLCPIHTYQALHCKI